MVNAQVVEVENTASSYWPTLEGHEGSTPSLGTNQ